MATVACPYCYRRIDQSRLHFQCTGFGAPGRAPCVKMVDETRERFTGYAQPAYPTFAPESRRLTAPRRAACPGCGGHTGVRACPACHTPLTAGFVEGNSPLIGMVGGKGAGKTVYLTVLNHELRYNVRRRFAADLRLTGDQQGGAGSTQAWLDGFERTLFAEKMLLRGTEAATNGHRAPVVLEWRQPRWILGRETFRTTVLSFYDAAGEDLTTQERVYTQSYLGVADGLILLLDPWQLPGARDHIDVPATMVRESEPPLSVLNRITELRRAASGTKVRRKITTPLAVVFAKIDALFPRLGQEHPLRSTPPAGPGYDEQAGNDAHEHVRALLYEFDADDIDTHLRANYKCFRYFAVSALGSAPDYVGGRVDSRGVVPFRVDEPLLWLLSRFGVIEKSRP
jgi:hypothetical protein